MIPSADDLPPCPLMQENVDDFFGWEHCPVEYDHMHFFLHVVPTHDLRLHQLDPTCWCNPREDDEVAGSWIHNAADQRERFETGAQLS